MASDRGICFGRSLPVLRRPRSFGGPISTRRIGCQRIYCFGQSAIRYQWRPPFTMSSNDLIATSYRETPAEHVLPSGAFTVFLKVKLQEEFSVRDQEVVLSEYGRKTCAEEGVLRCDILYEVTSRNVRKNKFYELWITFADRLAYSEHERSSHASRLRLCLENPSGGDNSVMLTKLAYDISLLKPVRPDVPSWRSAFDYSNEGNKASDANSLPFRSHAERNIDSESSAVRRSLNRLISSVGLENVTILICAAAAKCHDSSRKLRATCEDYLADLEKSAGIIRTGLLVDKNDPYKVVLMTIHDSSDDDGACFDMELGIDFVTEEEWKLKRCLAVFPDKGGWERRVDEGDISSVTPDGATILSPRKASHSIGNLSQITGQGQISQNELFHTSRQGVVLSDPPAPQSPKLRLLQGAGAFDSIKQYLREMIRMPRGDIRVMIIYGWNTSRIHDLVVQLEYDKRKDFGVIEYTIDFNVRSMDLTTERLEKGVAEVHKFRPDAIIGYGGGSVMDMAKAIAHVGAAEKKEVEEFAIRINNAADEDKTHCLLTNQYPPIPVMLVPTTIGSGAELTEPCIFSARKRDGGWRRIPVHFCEESEIVRTFASKTVLVDSRLLGPKRLEGFHASQGALQLTCLGIDVLISAHENLEEQYTSFALEGISLAFKGVIPALREPYKATGQSRDPLLNAKTTIGLAREGIGRIGVCTRLALGVIDSLIDGRYPTMFRMVLTRVTIAVVGEVLKTSERDDKRKRFLSLLCKVLQVEEGDEIVEAMLAKAEDCNVLLLKELGMVRRRIPNIARYVADCLTGPDCSGLEHSFADPVCIERVLQSALSQEYKL